MNDASKARDRAVPFFWSQHYDVTVNYVGHAVTWDTIDIDGRLQDNDCMETDAAPTGD